MPREESAEIMTDLKDRIKGALYAFAIGDALGAPVELMKKADIRKEYGVLRDMVGGGLWMLKPGEVTDDTVMMCCVADAILAGGTEEDILNQCCRNFEKMMKSGQKGVGPTVAFAIRVNEGMEAERWMFRNEFKQEWRKIKDLGNGGLMRSLFSILYYKGSPSLLPIMQGRLTHNNSICDGAIESYRSALEAILDSGNIDLSFSIGRRPMEPVGHVVNTLNNAIYYANTSYSVEEALTRAVNAGGDTDTIAALTGGLIGARCGFNGIPKRWVYQLDGRIKVKLSDYSEKIFENIQKKCLH